MKPVLIVQIGVNDSSERGSNRDLAVSQDQYEENLNDLVSRMQPSVSQIVFVGLSACDEQKVLPVSWGEFYYSNQNIREYEEIMQRVATEREIPFVAIFDEFTCASKSDKSLLHDGLHPTDSGHQLIYDIVKEQIDSVLQEVA